jgi:hypothetical protein
VDPDDHHLFVYNGKPLTKDEPALLERAGSSDAVRLMLVTERNAIETVLTEAAKVITTARGAYVVIHDPEGRCVILTEVD